MSRKLVFDVGLNNGDDAAYYLQLGYKVIGIEANPVLCDECSRRFESEIRAGDMTVINAGVMSQPGELRFYRHLQEDGWSTFDPSGNGKPGEFEEIKVSCITTSQLIERYGKPYYIKADIEGADFQVIQTLARDRCPAYISLELLNSSDPFVETLSELGYTGFKFVDGKTFWPGTPIFDHQWGWRLLRKIGTVVPPFREAMRALPQVLRPKSEWNPPGKNSPSGYAFTDVSSGPFGEEAAGQWLSPREASRWLDTLRCDYAKAGRGHSIWWDIHARHSSVAGA